MDEYIKSRLEKLNNAKTEEEKINFINKIYEEGFEDGVKSEKGEV